MKSLKATLLIVGLLVSTCMLAQVEKGKMNIKSYYSLTRHFKSDSTYDKAFFYTKNTIVYKRGEALQDEKQDYYPTSLDIVIHEGSEGTIVDFSVDKERGRLGNTVTYRTVIDFGDEILVTFIAQSFYSNNDRVKSWTKKDFWPHASLKSNETLYSLVGDPDKLSLLYSYDPDRVISSAN